MNETLVGHPHNISSPTYPTLFTSSPIFTPIISPYLLPHKDKEIMMSAQTASRVTKPSPFRSADRPNKCLAVDDTSF